MLVDLSCPVEIFRSLLPTEEIPAVSLTLYNLSDRTVASVEVTTILRGIGGGERERLTCRVRALSGRPRSTFSVTVPCTFVDGVKTVEVTVGKVWFTDNAVWRRDPDALVEVTPNVLPVSRALTNLKYVAGEIAVGYPSWQNGIWLCVCGRPNWERDEFCVRCGRERETVFAHFNREAVESQLEQRERQLDLATRGAREDTARMQRIREEEYHQQKQRRGRRIFLAVCLLLTAGAVAVSFFWGAPALKLQAARYALSQGDPAGARETALALGDFADARKLIQECDGLLAENRAKEAESPEELLKAAKELRAMPERENALPLAEQSELKAAALLLETGRWKEAEEAISRLPADNEERKKLEEQCLFEEAKELLEQGNYEEARVLFLSLENYPEAVGLASECIYLPALDQMTAGLWEDAISRLSQISDYKDSRTLIKRCHYMLGLAWEADGDLEAAGVEYLLAGDYGDGDARVRGQQVVYVLAEQAYDRGDLTKAQQLYASIPEYEDAQEKNYSCCYALAEKAMKETEYNRALELLQELPEDYRDTGSLRIQAAYHAAKDAARLENWQKVADLLSPLPLTHMPRGMRDAKELYLEACEALGIEPMLETPTPVPTSTPTATPTAVPTPAPTDPPAETTTLHPAEVPSVALSNVSEEAPGAAPSATSAEISSNVPSTASEGTPGAVPSATPMETSGVVPSSIPDEAPNLAPSDTSTETSTGIPSSAVTEAPAATPETRSEEILTESPAESGTEPSVKPSASTNSPGGTTPDLSFLVLDDEDD